MQVTSPIQSISEDARAKGDPLARVFALDGRRVRRALNLALAIALLAHVGGAAEAAYLGNGTYRWARDVRAEIQDWLRGAEIDLERTPPPEPPPPPAPTSEPEPEAKPAHAEPPPSKAPKNEPPPEPAQAGKVLTQEPNPDEPVDLTGGGFVTGNANSYAGGVTASNGTSATAVRNTNAGVGGVPGGTGDPKKAVVPDVDLSRAAALVDNTWGDCPFPPEADADQIDFQKVLVVVTVRADGTPQAVKVVSDPGHGFGRAARDCAMRHRFTPALDRSGHPILSSLPPFNVKFTR
jgi:protein TonB